MVDEDGTQACGWTLDSCGCTGDSKCWSSLTPSVRACAADLATHFLWAATGRRYGLCELTVLPHNPRPCEPLYQTFPLVARSGYGSPFAMGSQPGPVIEDGQWMNRGCGGACGCHMACEILLDGPVFDVVEILVDNEVVDPAAYRIDNGALLVRIDGECWPTCQRFDVEVPGFQVTYRLGKPIPPAVLLAAQMMTCEYGKLLSTGSCALPSRVTSLTRDGVSLDVAQVELDQKAGMLRTGVKIVDDVIAADNPAGRVSRPQVLSPDLPDHRYVTWQGGS